MAPSQNQVGGVVAPAGNAPRIDDECRVRADGFAAQPPRCRIRPNTPKRHHYVPEMLQKRFADPTGHLWYYDRSRPHLGVRRRPTRRLFVEWHLYTTVAPDGTRDTSTETRLSGIETRADPIFERVVQRARRRLAPDLSPADRRATCAFLVAQMRRVPDFHGPIVERQGSDAAVAQLAAEWERAYAPVTGAERADLESGRMAHRVRRNLIAGSAADPLEACFSALIRRDLVAAVIPRTHRGFVLGSYPMARLANPSGGGSLLDPGSELWLPLAPDVALVSHGLAGPGELVLLKDDAALRRINMLIARQSTIFAAASRELVAGHARRVSFIPRAAGRPGVGEEMAKRLDYGSEAA